MDHDPDHEHVRPAGAAGSDSYTPAQRALDDQRYAFSRYVAAARREISVDEYFAETRRRAFAEYERYRQRRLGRAPQR